jgi:hypothetical protein
MYIVCKLDGSFVKIISELDLKYKKNVIIIFGLLNGFRLRKIYDNL